MSLISAAVGSIAVVGALNRWTCNEIMLYEFEFDHNAAEATKTFVVRKMKAKLITVQ